MAGTLAVMFSMAIEIGMIYLFATLGEIYAERSGVLNLGVEGLIMLGAATGFAIAFESGSILLGLLGAMVICGVVSLIHGFVSISMRGNQIVSGLALTMLGMGLGALIGSRYIGKPLRIRIYSKQIPILSKIPVLGVMFQQNVIVYFGYVLAILLWFILYYTKWGLKIRAVGENPAAAEALGVNIDRIRYSCVMIGGCLAGLSGAYMSIVYMGSWNEVMTLGKGWIALALVIVSLWNPLLALFTSILFGFLDVLAIWLRKHGMDPHILGTLPYIITIVTMTIARSMVKRIGIPEALAKPYIREEEALYGV